MTTQTKTDLRVSSLADAALALAYARNAMLEDFSVTIRPGHPLRSRSGPTAQAAADTLNRLQGMMTAAYQSDGSFTGGQQSGWHCSCGVQPLTRQAQLNATVQYLTTAKETNDLTCVAAEIGSLLKAQMGDRPTVWKIIQVYQAWVNRYFSYVQTGQAQDHSAMALFRSRTGVCQAIAALAVLVLPHMGLQTCYIGGEGGRGEQRAPHAWNAVRAVTCIPGGENTARWHHVDFTFGMTGLTPNTLTDFSSRLFLRTHSWDQTQYGDVTLNSNMCKANSLSTQTVHLSQNSPDWALGCITVASPRPLLTGNAAAGHWLDFYTLLRFLGGSCEFIGDINTLRVCMGGRQWLVPEAARYLTGPAGYVSVSILRQLPFTIDGTESTLSLKAVIS